MCVYIYIFFYLPADQDILPLSFCRGSSFLIILQEIISWPNPKAASLLYFLDLSLFTHSFIHSFHFLSFYFHKCWQTQDDWEAGAKMVKRQLLFARGHQRTKGHRALSHILSTGRGLWFVFVLYAGRILSNTFPLFSFPLSFVPLLLSTFHSFSPEANLPSIDPSQPWTAQIFISVLGHWGYLHVVQITAITHTHTHTHTFSLSL